MTSDFDLSTPEPSRDAFLTVDDPRFSTESVAIVTGGASGIGQATAVGLALNGLTVVATDVDEAGLAETQEIATELDAPGTVESVVADLTDDDDVAAMVEAAADRGQLRYVANIAGLQHIDPIDEFPMETYDLMQRIMVRAPFLVTKHAIPHIRAGDSEASSGTSGDRTRSGDGVGAIGNMSSVHGHYATQAKPAYITAKFALRGLTQAIAAEGGGTLRGFSVSVGYVLTPLMVNQIEDTAAELGMSPEEVIEKRFLGQARTKEMMTPAEVANLFTFGFSRHGKHLNGGDMLWDGGYTTTYE
ncbi:SDR family oxidoreductase [Salinigranum salinum]|uniref:SDR family oxidoreductase n=1 Tax=Salinigranum salinum TaxID=1364937 RepID=UPI00126133C5|nr:SDR family oxidoreductase [Salinigranum salinum]